MKKVIDEGKKEWSVWKKRGRVEEETGGIE